MLKRILLTLLVSTFLVFGGLAISMAADLATEDESALVKCSTCTMSFAAMTDATQHMTDYPEHQVTVAGDPLIKCSTCGVVFTSAAGLQQHMQENPDHKAAPLIKCSTCGTEFTSPGQWKEHLDKHPDHGTR